MHRDILNKTARKHAVAALAFALAATACNDELTEPLVEPVGGGASAFATVAGDRAVLVALYEATNGPDWDDSHNWLTDAPLNAWHGVETHGSGRVRSLRLSANNLAGEIPPELGNLTRLNTLILGRNKLEGEIPSELGNLTNLKELDLSNVGWPGWRRGGLAGEIPPALSNLSDLQHLDLSRNGLTGAIPYDFGSLENLSYLYLHGNRLGGGLPPALADLPLRRLHWGDNAGLCAPGTQRFITFVKATEYSSEGPFCHEADAEVLRSVHGSTGGSTWTHAGGWLQSGPLDDWHGVETDTAFGRVVGLDLRDNELVGQLTSKLTSLDSLRDLRLDGNAALEGRLPLGMTALPLRTLSYEGTAVCAPEDPAFRAWLGSLSSHAGTAIDCPPLTDRDVLEILFDATGGRNWHNSDNWLTDAPLNTWHGVGTDEGGRVQTLFLYDNGLTGEIPPELGNLSNLRVLELLERDLTGVIPPELGGLSNLMYLSLSLSKLTGEIPPELGGLSNLRALTLWRNNLSGEIPPELGGLSNLERLSLGGWTWALLTGGIPSELGNLSNLRVLELEDHDLTGVIPPELGGLSNLERLRLSDNNLTGGIPSELGNLSNLRVLGLDGNDLTGVIPPELGNLSNLRVLGLDGNDLTGVIPPELGGLSNLEQLGLSNNNLTGIPTELDGLSNLRALGLSGNAGLSGALPRSFANLRGLRTINLSGTALCAPDDFAIRLWLRSMSLHRADRGQPVNYSWSQYVPICKAQTRAATATAYIVQGVQSANVPVPLVAGKQGLLRVLVTAPEADGARVPAAWAIFYHPDGSKHRVRVRSGMGAIPAEVEVAEGSLARSANVEVPGEVLRPGVEMVVVVDPEGALDPALGVPRRIPATGRTALDVYEMPSFDVTVVPFLWETDPDSSILDATSGLTADARLFEETLLLPIGEMSVTVHEPVWTSINNKYDLLRETSAIRSMEGGTSYYMGTAGSFTGGGGIGPFGARYMFSGPWPLTVAHEFGHNLMLYHAPCGTKGDPGYPHSNGRIGVWGYDHRSRSLVRPGGKDIMSYCDPSPGFSDYSFAKAFWWRLSVEAGTAEVTYEPARALLLWGGVGPGGRPFLNPAFVVEAPPTRLDGTGAWQVAGEAEDGRVLFTRRFDMAEMADGDGRQSFAFALAAESSWADALSRIVLTGPDGEATMDAQSGPTAALLRHPATGRVRGILRDWPGSGAAAQPDGARGLPEPGLEVQVSRGVPAPTAWRR